jgi:hypothetical protein
MITAENSVVCFGKAGGSQEFLDGIMRELYGLSGKISTFFKIIISTSDNGK